VLKFISELFRKLGLRSLILAQTDRKHLVSPL